MAAGGRCEGIEGNPKTTGWEKLKRHSPEVPEGESCQPTLLHVVAKPPAGRQVGWVLECGLRGTDVMPGERSRQTAREVARAG